VRWCGRPSIVAQHSKQIPMPHNGPRGVPVTDCRAGRPAIIIATAAVQPAGTCMGLPLMLTDMESLMAASANSFRQVWLAINFRFAAGDQIGNQFAGGQRSRNSEAFMASGKI
jgi:hypothetical protein